MKKHPVLLYLVACLCLLAVTPGLADREARGAETASRPHHIVVFGDPHLPGKYLAGKEHVKATVNGWDDVDRIAVVGDICDQVATKAELAFAREFLGGLDKPVDVITGNHDYYYSDDQTFDGRKIRADAEVRRTKLRRFRETFGLETLYYSRRIGPYTLIYLSVDDLDSPYLTQLSAKQRAWFEAELASSRERPTIVFFHAPLAGTLPDTGSRANAPSYIAQPQEEIRGILRRNPQVFLWVAGHMHVPATEPGFNAPVNLFDGRVLTVHNANLNRKTIWTNSLYLHPDRVVIRTYDHRAGLWLDALERTVPPPRQP